jgi:hypothetical protein
VGSAPHLLPSCLVFPMIRKLHLASQQTGSALRDLDDEGAPTRPTTRSRARRYQKGRRDDALVAFDAALTAAPDNIEVWDAYLDYITYAVSAAALLAVAERMPAPIRAQKLPDVGALGGPVATA